MTLHVKSNAEKVNYITVLMSSPQLFIVAALFPSVKLIEVK